jgi:fructose-specific component phosphotransferase system IIB-like protein
MTGLNQNDLEYLQDLINRGEITADKANVEMVKMARVKIVISMPSSIRKALNLAVKNGELGHMKKSGHKPEVYYHPNFEHLANSERNRIEKESFNAIIKCTV